MTELAFTITFLSPFRVSQGHAQTGVEVLDRADPLPSTSIKGVMRATAFNLLGTRSSRVKEVFGSGSRPCPWRWSSATPESGWRTPQTTARVRIDPETHTAAHDMLAFAEQTSAAHATFTITQFGHVPPENLATHRLILAISAQATRSLGALRRRGLGWVCIRCHSLELTEADVREFLRLKA